MYTGQLGLLLKEWKRKHGVALLWWGVVETSFHNDFSCF